MSTENDPHETPDTVQALAAAGQRTDLALLNAVHHWAVATTDAESHCRRDLLKSKKEGVALLLPPLLTGPG